MEFKLTWDDIDMLFDLYGIYQLEQGLVIDKMIIRNCHVVNGILVFAVIGLLKMVLSIFVVRFYTDTKDADKISINIQIKAF